MFNEERLRHTLYHFFYKGCVIKHYDSPGDPFRGDLRVLRDRVGGVPGERVRVQLLRGR